MKKSTWFLLVFSISQYGFSQTSPANTCLSSDGDYSVKIVDVNNDAFLYLTTSQPQFKPLYLASNVKRAEFIDLNNGAPNVRLTLLDGSVTELIAPIIIDSGGILYKGRDGSYHYNFDDGDEHYPYWVINGPAFLNQESSKNKHFLGNFRIVKKVYRERAFIISGYDVYGGESLFYLRVPKTWKEVGPARVEKNSSLPQFQVSAFKSLMIYVTNDSREITDKDGKIQKLNILDLCFVKE